MATPEVEGAPLPSLSAQQYLPKSRKRTKAGRYSHEITYEELSQHFHLPTEKACQKLGVGLTILKRICRRFGLPRWPYKKPAKPVYAPTPSTYTRPVPQTVDTSAAAVNYNNNLSDTPAANYLRQQGYGQPSPFTTVPHPTGWEMPLPWPHHAHHAQQQQQSMQLQQQLEGCSRPIPRRLVSNGEKSVPQATLRAIGVSTDTVPSNEGQTDRLDLLISAIDHSEHNLGGDWETGGGDRKHRSERGIKEPSSPASVNTLQGSPTTSFGGSPSTGGNVNEAALAAAAAALIGNVPDASPSPSSGGPVVLQAIPDASITNTSSNNTTLADALAQLTNNTIAAPSGQHSSAHAIQSLVEVLAAHPDLAQQFKRLLNQPKEPSAFVEQYNLLYPSLPQQQQQQQQQDDVAMQEQSAVAAISAAVSNDKADLLAHLLQRQQQQQQQQQLMNGDGGNSAAATAAAAALRRAQLSAKFQALQAKLAARQVALQKLQSHMELQNVLAAQQTHLSGRPITAAPPTSTTAAAGGGSAAARAPAAPVLSSYSADLPGSGALSAAGGNQNERREVLLRLLAAKLQNQY